MLTAKDSAPAKARFPSWLIIAIGYLISIVCLVLVYRDFQWESQWERIRQTEWYWILLAIVTDVAVYAVQGWRWNTLLSPVGTLPAKRSMQAIYIGLFANEVLPLRPGEVIRSFLQARWSGVPFSVVLSSVFIERLFDGVWLILGCLAASYFVTLPMRLVIGTRILALILLTLTFLLGIAIFRRRQAERMLHDSIWAQGMHELLASIELMGKSHTFMISFLISFLYLALQVGPIYFLQRGFDLNLSLAACGVVLVLLRIGSIPPQAPGNVGSFQVLTIVGVMLFGVPRQAAVGFATLLFFVVTGPLWMVGFVALLATKMKLSHLHSAASGTK